MVKEVNSSNEMRRGVKLNLECIVDPAFLFFKISRDLI